MDRRLVCGQDSLVSVDRVDCGLWVVENVQKPVVFPHKVKGQPMKWPSSGGMETDPVLSSVSSGVESGVLCLFQVYILVSPEPGPFWLE